MKLTVKSVELPTTRLLVEAVTARYTGATAASDTVPDAVVYLARYMLNCMVPVAVVEEGLTILITVALLLVSA